jgi:hypothetical protein
MPIRPVFLLVTMTFSMRLMLNPGRTANPCPRLHNDVQACPGGNRQEQASCSVPTCSKDGGSERREKAE